MVTEMKKYRVVKSQLRNERKEGEIELEIRFDYKCDSPDESSEDTNCSLCMKIYDRNHHTSIESSPIYISIEFEATFAGSSENKDELSNETFRLLYPFVQAYIVQLTSGAGMQPLRIPYIPLASIRAKATKKKATNKPKQTVKA